MTRILRLARRKLLIWSLLEAVGLLLGGLSVAGLIALGLSSVGAVGGWGRGIFLLWLCLVGVVMLWKMTAALLAISSNRTFIRRIETAHPEYRNEISTAEYLAAHEEESQAFGFSPDLVRAVIRDVENLPEPRWESLGIGFSAKKRGLFACGFGILAFALASFLLPAQVYSVMEIWLLGRESMTGPRLATIHLPGHLEIPIGREVSIGPVSSAPDIGFDWGALKPDAKVEFLARSPGRAWKWLGAVHKSENPDSPPALSLKVEGPLELYASVAGARGNLCRIEPVYPPAVVEFKAVAAPPAYVDRAPQTFQDRKVVESLEGSRLSLAWTANNDLAAATFELYSETNALLSRVPLVERGAPKTVHTEFDLNANQLGRLLLLDRFGQKGIEPDIRFLTLPDRAPEVAILSPTREIVLPQDLRVGIDALVSDDISLARVELVYRVDTGLPGASEKRETIADSGTIESATGQILKHTLDLTSADLWPGDQVAYWIEATDRRGESPGLVGRSETHIVRFPTVEESLDEMTALRSESTDGLQELLEEQKEIGRQFKEIRQDLQRNLSNRSDPNKQWENQKKLAETLDRQSEIEKELSEVADQLDESLKRLSDDNQLTLRTLQKFERVQQLMDEVLTDETKRIIQEIQETLKRLQKDELQPDAMEETERELAEFEKQLDRQLELLENLWMEQELEALRDQVQELADRQEELKESTTDLLSEEEKQDLARKETEEESLADQMDNLESTAERLADELAQDDTAKAEEKDPTEAAQSQEETQSEEAESKLDSEQNPEREEGSDSHPETSESHEEEQESQEQNRSQSQESQSEPQSSDSPQSEEDSESTEQPTGDLPKEEEVLAQRQEQLAKDTERTLDDLKRLAEKAKEKDHPSSEQMEQLAKSPQQESIPSDQQSAERNLRRDQPQRAAQNQSSASKKLAEMAQSLSACCAGGDQNMEESIAQMKEILERAFILSEEGEASDQEMARFRPLPEWPNPGKMSGYGQRMGLYKQEATRLSEMFGEIAEGNPFADFEVIRRLDRAARNWKENTRVMEESPPLPVSVRAHQSVAQVNLAIERLLESISQSESNCMSGSSGMEGYFRGLKQVLSEQKSLNQESQQTKDRQEGTQPGQESGEGTEQMSWQEKLQRMADQQRQTRQMLEDLEQRYQDMKQRTGSLEGIGEDMQAVEKELEEGRLNEQVVQTQKKIEQRLLDAEKSLHNQGFKKSRRALRAGEDPLAPLVEGPEPTQEELEADLARLLRNDLSDVPVHWRDRVRSYYDNLLRMNP